MKGRTARYRQVLHRTALFTANDEPMEPTMIRTLLTTTAMAVLLTTGAIAQDAAPANDATTTNEMAPADNSMAPADNTMAPADNTMAPADNTMAPADNTMAPADNSMAPADNTMAPADTAKPSLDAGSTTMSREPFDMSAGYTAVDTDNLATRLIGQPVYSGTGDDAEEIGSVNDLVFTQDGQISAVIIGVGGFLGIGEKNVAVDFSSLSFEIAADNTERWVLPTTADALTNAPDFQFEEDTPADNTMAPADNGAMAPADNTMAPADNTTAPATN